MEKLLAQYNAGIISLDEFNAILNSRGIRGTVRDNGSFIGYDYDNQEWIDTAIKFVGTFKMAETGEPVKVYTDENGLLTI